MKLEPSDYRRAAALIVHFGTENHDGVKAVLDEVVEDGRAAAILMAVLSVYDEMIPELRSPLGLSLLSSFIMRVAGQETAA